MPLILLGLRVPQQFSLTSSYVSIYRYIYGNRARDGGKGAHSTNPALMPLPELGLTLPRESSHDLRTWRGKEGMDRGIRGWKEWIKTRRYWVCSSLFLSVVEPTIRWSYRHEVTSCPQVPVWWCCWMRLKLLTSSQMLIIFCLSI